MDAAAGVPTAGLPDDAHRDPRAGVAPAATEPLLIPYASAGSARVTLLYRGGPPTGHAGHASAQSDQCENPNIMIKFAKP